MSLRAMAWAVCVIIFCLCLVLAAVRSSSGRRAERSSRKDGRGAGAAPAGRAPGVRREPAPVREMAMNGAAIESGALDLRILSGMARWDTLDAEGRRKVLSVLESASLIDSGRACRLLSGDAPAPSDGGLAPNTDFDEYGPGPEPSLSPATPPRRMRTQRQEPPPAPGADPFGPVITDDELLGAEMTDPADY